MKTITHILKDGTLITAFEGDHISNIIGRTNYYYEGSMLDYIKENIPKGLMVDVGANIGNHSIYLAKYCATTVLAFEPFPASFELLKKNLIQNNILNVKPINFGLSNEEKRVFMTSVNGNAGMNRIDDNGMIAVQVVTFECKGIEPITLIKIDCEGYEEKALLGMIETIKEHKPALFIECQTLMEYQTINTILAPLGYVMIQKFNSTPTYFLRHG